MVDTHQDASRPRRPFRLRLTKSLGWALGTSFFLLGVLFLIGAWGFMNYGALTHLSSELNNYATILVIADTLDLEAPPWEEPHHLLTTPRIDPHFIQIFDNNDQPLRSSTNVAHFDGAFPAQRLPVTDDDLRIRPLRTFSVNDHRLYHLTTSLKTSEGATLGYLQIARYEPGIGTMLGRLSLGIIVGYAFLLTALLVLLWSVGGRVIRPLQAITSRAQNLSPKRLDERVAIPDNADCETAQLGSAINDALSRMQGAFEEVGQFTADAAHELQTPLTVILGHIEVGLRHEREPAAYQETLRVLQRETEELIHTVHGLLSLARLEGSPELRQPVALNFIVREEVEAAQRQVEEKDLTLTIEAEANARVLGHPALIREAVRNLIDNAVKYTNAGSISVSVGTQGKQIELVVDDTGIGIASENISRATARFWRADNVQHLPGSGLGLSLVEHVAAHYGGRFSIRSTPGVGTRTELLLPALLPKTNPS